MTARDKRLLMRFMCELISLRLFVSHDRMRMIIIFSNFQIKANKLERDNWELMQAPANTARPKHSLFVPFNSLIKGANKFVLYSDALISQPSAASLYRHCGLFPMAFDKANVFAPKPFSLFMSWNLFLFLFSFLKELI